MLKVLFIIVGRDAASSRVRCLDMQPVLAQHGIECDITELPNGLLARWQLFRRARYYDVVMLQKKLPSFPTIRLLRFHAKRLIYDIDDAVYCRDAPCGAPSSAFQHRARAAGFRRVVRMADRVIAANRVLADAVHGVCPQCQVTVLPSGIQLAGLPRKHKFELGEPPVVGWVGTTATQKYLAHLLPALRSAHEARPFELRVVSERPPELPGLSVKFVPWSLATQNDEIANFDIGLMPLSDDSFAAGKAAYKLLQYLAAGVPAVCSAVGMNADISDANKNCLAASSHDEFAGHMQRLFQDQTLRETLAERGQRLVEKEYSLERLGARLAETLKDVSSDG